MISGCRAKALSLLLVAHLLSCTTPGSPLAVVEEVDLDRYQGRWYEIASFPQSFQRGCVATTADYSSREDGRIRVVNQCRTDTFDGELRTIEGVAWVSDEGGSNAKLRVQFFWPFSGAYWIIDLDPHYRYAVVGHPNRDYLWILSRTPTLEPTLYSDLLRRIEAMGFDVSRLRITAQPE